ncbi:MAG TPA: aminodeoxychorismate/anthranilate synthase component II [Aggregatilineales bacterium]|nr:aminodeoxychorismate/anthranilate synthase component II [Anaerolineales bacterium]HRE48256.1 aminodeoxychorismate/anthranilate synthase component II [Aggregatilineales bacterium]
MIVLIDNYDSFTYNLAQAFGMLGADIRVYRNDALSVEDVEALAPSHIIISPGPGDPDDGGISLEVIRRLGTRIPTLGVCLGHQCIGQAFGGTVSRAPRLMHGKTSLIYHKSAPIFTGVPNPFEATRYHSLIVEEGDLPKELKVTAFTDQGEIMALQHTKYPILGVQFHPESILTSFGPRLMQNFLECRF